MFTDTNGDIDMKEVGDFVKDCVIGWLQAQIAIVVISISAVLQLFGEIGFFSGIPHPLAFSIGYFLMFCVLAWFWLLCVYFITILFAFIHPMIHKILYWSIWTVTTGILALTMIQGGAYRLHDDNRVVTHYGERYTDRGYQSM